MPLYAYKCASCEKEFEQEQSFSEESIKDCPYCGAKGSVKRVYSDVAVIYHGTGYYCTDHKSGCGDCPHHD